MKARLAILCLSLFACLSYFCTVSEPGAQPEGFLNLNDTVGYVGINSCKNCHAEIYQSYVGSNKGKSFRSASRAQNSAAFNISNSVYDKEMDFWYKSYMQNDSIYILEYRLSGNDTIHKRTRRVDHVIGGSKFNSFLTNNNGYLFQLPVALKTLVNNWELNPNYLHDRFNGIAGMECMSCHNGHADFITGSENKFTKLPDGIDCENCHGPGAIHVAEMEKSNTVDTSKYIDYTIVNPARISVDLQFDACERCHLQGNVVLKEGKSFYDFKPGMHLKDVMHVFLPGNKNTESKFSSAAYPERLKQSQCFIKSGATPGKNALTCTTCHNPHADVKSGNTSFFIQKCNSCHSKANQVSCSEKPELRAKNNDDCVSCHMPFNGPTDLPHQGVRDHYIRKKPTVVTTNEKDNSAGLYCVNDPSPDDLTLARAYLQQFNRSYPADGSLLDSALKRLPSATVAELKNSFSGLVKLYYFKKQYNQIKDLVWRYGPEEVYGKVLTRKSPANEDAWTAYRIGEAYSFLGEAKLSYEFYHVAYMLAPDHFEFANKFGLMALNNARPEEARKVLEKLVIQNPDYVPGLSNFGYLKLLENKPLEAEKYYTKALALDPDYEQGLLNMAGLYIMRKEKAEAKKLLDKVLKRNPSNKDAIAAMKQVK